MTSTPQPGDINKLEGNDLFLVNKDIDGDQSKYETMAVRYKDMLGPVTGDEGPTGPTGATGIQGEKGDPGTSITVLGVFPYYNKNGGTTTDSLALYSNTLTGEDQIEYGTVYIVEDDYSTDNANRPGENYINTDENPPVPQKNVAYVYSPKANFGQGQNRPDGSGDSFVRIGPLTGADGKRGATGPYYDIIETIDTPDEFRIVYKDSGNPNVGSKYDPTKYLAEDGLTYFPGLDADTVEGDVRGATGPYYDKVEAIQTMVTKPNPDYPDIPGQDEFLKYPSTKLVFTASTGPGGSDPHGVLEPNPYISEDIVGATGPGGGPAGPEGEKGDEGATGPYYDSVSGVKNHPDVTPRPGSDGTTFSLMFHASTTSDPNDVLENPLHLKQDLMGPAVDEETIINIINGITIPEPDSGEWEGPYVHRGSACGTGDNVNENIYGRKTIRDRLAFNPCDRNDQRMIDFPANMSLYAQQNVWNGKTTINCLRLFDRGRPTSGKKNAITLAIRDKGSSGDPAASVGIKCEKPQAALEVKGRTISNSFSATETAYYDSGRSLDSFSETNYAAFAITWNRKNDDQKEFRIGGPNTDGRQSEGLIRLRNSTIVEQRFEASVPSENFLIRNLKLGGGNFYVTCSNQGVIKRRDSPIYRIADVSESTYTIGEYMASDVALTAIKSLKPRLTTNSEGQTTLKLVNQDIPVAQRSTLGYEEEDGEKVGSLENLVNLLVLSIQKLEDRISVLEAQ